MHVFYYVLTHSCNFNLYQENKINYVQHEKVPTYESVILLNKC